VNGVPDLLPLPMMFLLVTALALISILQGTHHQIIAEASVPRFIRPSGSQQTSRRNNNSLLQIERKSFLWSASLNRRGIASSFEQSVFEVRGINEISLPNKDEVTKMARQLFSNYPDFLGRPSLTLGLCRAVPSSKNCHLQTSLFPLDVLTFGTPRVVSSKPHSRNSHGEKWGDGISIIGLGEVLCCIEIPIVGGLLVANNLDPSSSSSKSITKREHDHGCLRFTWLSIKNHRQQQPKIVLVTEIAGNYRPSLAGNKLPTPAWRNMVYCSTQRMFHAYVMWRFHLFVAKEYRRKIIMDSHIMYDK